jgi:hypothetical protein
MGNAPDCWPALVVESGIFPVCGLSVSGWVANLDILRSLASEGRQGKNTENDIQAHQKKY